MSREKVIDDADLGATVRAKVVSLRKLDSDLDKKKSKRSEACDLFCEQWRQRGLPKMAREFPFAKEIKRMWRFDVATVITKPSGRVYRLAIEIEGIVMRRAQDGSWQMGGRHATVQGFKEDNIKYATATLLGWNVVRFEQSQVSSEFAIKMVIRILSRNGWRSAS